MKSLITTLSVLAIATAYAAAADETTTTRREAIGEKVKAKAEERFKSLDANHDDALTMDEFKAGALGKRDPSKAETFFNRKDTNRDGKLTWDEYSARVTVKGEEIEEE